jgi:hypothetical protein
MTPSPAARQNSGLPVGRIIVDWTPTDHVQGIDIAVDILPLLHPFAQKSGEVSAAAGTD